MTTHVAAIALLGALLVAGGCATSPAPAPAAPAPTPVAAKAAPQSPTLTAPTMSQPTLAPVAPKESTSSGPSASETAAVPKLSPEATALIERLTRSADGDTLPHEMADSTTFGVALKSLQPGAHAPRVESSESSYQPPVRGLTADGNTTALVERDWTGLVLVPIAKSLSKAYTSDVRLTKVEAHPLTDGRVRVWTRVQNVGHDTLPAEIACEFRLVGSHLSSPYFYQLEVPPSGYRDVFFVSPEGEMNAYTVLVRAAEIARR